MKVIYTTLSPDTAYTFARHRRQRQEAEAGGRGRRQRQEAEAGSRGRKQGQEEEAGGSGRKQKQQAEAAGSWVGLFSLPNRAKR